MLQEYLCDDFWGDKRVWGYVQANEVKQKLPKKPAKMIDLLFIYDKLFLFLLMLLQHNFLPLSLIRFCLLLPGFYWFIQFFIFMATSSGWVSESETLVELNFVCKNVSGRGKKINQIFFMLVHSLLRLKVVYRLFFLSHSWDNWCLCYQFSFIVQIRKF